MNVSTDINVWISAILVLSVFSVLYKENPVYRFAESLFIGVTSGYFFCIWFFSVIKPAMEDALSGQWHLFVPILTGLLILIFRESKYSRFLSVPATFLAGIFIALNFIVYFRAYIIDMISASIFPLVVFKSSGQIDWSSTINSIISITGTVSVLIFFIARRYPGVKMIRKYGEVGRFYLLVAIGACFGYTLFSRILLFAGRFDFLISGWLGISFR